MTHAVGDFVRVVFGGRRLIDCEVLEVREDELLVRRGDTGRRHAVPLKRVRPVTRGTDFCAHVGKLARSFTTEPPPPAKPRPRQPVERSEAYRRWVADQPCCWCGLEGQSQAAHYAMGGSGMALKDGDLLVVPLCADSPGRQGCHSMVDTSGWIALASRRPEVGWPEPADVEVELRRAQVRLLRQWVLERAPETLKGVA